MHSQASTWLLVIDKILICISCILILYSFMRDIFIIYNPPQPRNSNYRYLSTCPTARFPSLLLIHFHPCLLFTHSLHLCLALSVKYTTVKVIKSRIQQSSFVALDLATMYIARTHTPLFIILVSLFLFFCAFFFLSKCRQGRRGRRNSKTYQKIQSKGGNQKRKKP
ncbi:hypothetical protein GGI35DRAFT_17705 [Trichoderma velutinum]